MKTTPSKVVFDHVIDIIDNSVHNYKGMLGTESNHYHTPKRHTHGDGSIYDVIGIILCKINDSQDGECLGDFTQNIIASKIICVYALFADKIESLTPELIRDVLKETDVKIYRETGATLSYDSEHNGALISSWKEVAKAVARGVHPVAAIDVHLNPKLIKGEVKEPSAV